MKESNSFIYALEKEGMENFTVWSVTVKLSSFYPKCYKTFLSGKEFP